MPVEASGDGALITVHVQFPHQSIAGKTYYDLDTDTYKTYLNPLPYTDEDGRLEDYELYFTPDVLFEDAGQYPLILDQTSYLANTYTISDVSEALDLDTAASFAKTFQISFIADENIYIGNVMASKNYFVKDQATATAPKIYTSSKPYGEYDQTVRSYDTDNTANISYTYSYINGTITITPSIDIEYFSIVKDDDILLAINKSIKAGETVVIYNNHLGSRVTAIVISIAMQTVNSSSEILYLQALNQALSAEFNVTATSELVSEIGKFNYAASSEQEAVATSEIVYIQAANFSHIIELSATATSDITYYTIKDTLQAIELEVTVTLEVITFASLNPEPVEWVVVTSGTPDIDQCVVLGDIGNIREVTGATYCEFQTVGIGYLSGTDLSTTQPVCSQDATYTLCLFTGSNWSCRDYIGEVITPTTLYECQLK